MEESGAGEGRVWRSNREQKESKAVKAAVATRKPPPDDTKRISPALLEPMYASVGSEIPGKGWTFEPKYDGIRVLAYVTATDVNLMTRNGKDKAKQFPEVVSALMKLAAQSKRSLVLDGEFV